jgi:hypothetical protein
VSGSAKHFVAYQSNPSTVVLNNQSLNNSSVTDVFTGGTDFNLVSSMAQTKYAIPDSGGDNNAGFSTLTEADTNMTTSSYRYVTGDASFSAQDTNFHSCMVLGDLA